MGFDNDRPEDWVFSSGIVKLATPKQDSTLKCWKEQTYKGLLSGGTFNFVKHCFTHRAEL